MKYQIIILFLVSSFAFSIQLDAQKVRWAYKVNDSQLGAGTPGAWEAGYSIFAASLNENKRRAKDPAILHYYFHPFAAQQLIIYENYNPGAISKIEIEYHVKNKKFRKVVYEAETIRSKKDYLRRNIYFETIKNISGVYLYLDYMKIDGLNQIAGVALANFKKEYIAYINTPDINAFEGKPMDINDDVSGMANPTIPQITIDNKYIYFCHDNKYTNIYRGTLGEDGKLIKVEYSKYNLPIDKSAASGLTSISQDNNAVYINSLDMDKMNLYKVYLGKNIFGSPKWKYDKISVRGYKNDYDAYQNEIMSYDGQFLICRMGRKKGKYKGFKGELYVFFKQKNGSFAKPTHLGFDINTIEDEVPCYLAPDNKTLFFSSNGHLGYGLKDIYVTTRLDDSWQNWSMPINLGKPINSAKHENYFILDSKAEFAYFVVWNDDKSDIFRIKLAKPEKVKDSISVVKQIKPEPIVVFQGKVLDKKSNKPIYASIVYTDLATGKQMGSAMSNAETGEYSIALKMGYNYGFEAIASKYITVSENIDAINIKESKIISKNLYLIPIEVGQSIVLNNIFFETAKSTLKKESDTELNKLLKIMLSNKKLKIQIGGHTDNIGSEKSNLSLSQNRAKAVVEWLVAHNIDPMRIIAKGFGEAQPIASNNTKEGRSMNRRVEFTILEN